MKLDERGIPITTPDQICAPHHPPSPCQLCPSGKPVNGQDPWEWCQNVDTCAATIDCTPDTTIYDYGA